MTHATGKLHRIAAHQQFGSTVSWQ